MTHYDYGFRIYNPSIGKFLSVDPLSPDYPWYTPYQFAGNTPIQAIDLDGLEPQSVVDQGGYDIQKGDTFWDLNARWGLSQGTLESYNPNVNPEGLQIGQTIRVIDPSQLASDYYSDIDDGSGFLIGAGSSGEYLGVTTPQKVEDAKDVLDLIFLGTFAMDFAAAGAFPNPGARSKPRSFSYKPITTKSTSTSTSVKAVKNTTTVAPVATQTVKTASSSVGSGVTHVRGNLYRATEGAWLNPSGQATFNRGFISGDAIRIRMPIFNHQLTTSRGIAISYKGLGLNPASGSSPSTMRFMLQGSYINNPSALQKIGGAGAVGLGAAAGYFKYRQELNMLPKKQEKQQLLFRKGTN